MSIRLFLSVLLISLLCVFISQAGDETMLDSKIVSVTVYPNWAKITRKAEIEVTPGDRTFRIENLPIGADENSFRVSAFGIEGTRIMGFRHGTEAKFKNANQRVAELQAELKDINRSRKEPLMAISERLNAQKDLLTMISMNIADKMRIEIKTGAVNATGWDNAYGFFQKKFAILLDSINTVNHRLSDLEDTLSILNSEIKDAGNSRYNQYRFVEIDMEFSRAGKIEIQLEYIIRGASWTPLYNITYDPGENRVGLMYFASITQNTGEDWDDVDLYLSTAQPAHGVGPQEFRPWYLFGREPQPVVESPPPGNAYAGIVSPEEVKESSQTDLGRVIRVSARADRIERFETSSKTTVSAEPAMADIMRSGMNKVFHCPRLETVGTGGDPEKVSIGIFDFDSKLSLISRPKLAGGVFRQIELANTSEVPILPGRAGVFSDAGYIGHTAIDEPILPGDTIIVNFGHDSKFKVERKIIKRKNSYKGDKRKREETIQIVVTNFGDKSQKVRLEEPTPVSQDNRIKVDIDKIEPKPDKSGVNGIEEWTFEIPANASDTVMVEYKVEYPSDLTVLNL